MKQQKYNMWSGVFFTIHALAAILLIGFGTDVSVGGEPLPLVLVYSGAFLSLLFAYCAFKLLK